MHGEGRRDWRSVHRSAVSAILFSRFFLPSFLFYFPSRRFIREIRYGSASARVTDTANVNVQVVSPKRNLHHETRRFFCRSSPFFSTIRRSPRQFRHEISTLRQLRHRSEHAKISIYERSTTREHFGERVIRARAT